MKSNIVAILVAFVASLVVSLNRVPSEVSIHCPECGSRSIWSVVTEPSQNIKGNTILALYYKQRPLTEPEREAVICLKAFIAGYEQDKAHGIPSWRCKDCLWQW